MSISIEDRQPMAIGYRLKPHSAEDCDQVAVHNLLVDVYVFDTKNLLAIRVH